MKLSIVTTVYCSAPYIKEFYDRIVKSAKKITNEFEIIFVNDGSPDHSLEILIKLHENDPRVKIIDLSRNFGHHKAMMAGLSYISGQYVFMIDTDLEEPPELLIGYWNKMQEVGDTDVVYGHLIERKGSYFEKVSGSFFYRILNLLSGENMPVDISFSRLMTRRYTDSLKQFSEREMYIGGLWHIAGFNQVAIPMIKKSRGDSSYTFRKKIEMMVNAVTSFSNMPLRMIFYFGLFEITLAIVLMIFYAVRKLVYVQVLTGWTTLIVFMLFLSGSIVFSIGIVAIYLSKIFIEVKNRPYVIVKHKYISGEKND